MTFPSRFIALCVSTCGLAACLPDSRSYCTGPSSSRAYFDTPAAEQDMNSILENMVQCLPEDRAQVYAEQTAPNADDEVRAVLAALYADAEPDIDALRALGNRLDVLLRPAERRPSHTTLLNEAVRQKNYRWLVALLEAGADPNGSGSLMAYTAADTLFNPSSPPMNLFRDGSPAVAVLQAYLDHGGLVNTTAGGGYGDPALIDHTYNNLEARVFLLESGADPWLSSGAPDRLSFPSTTLGGLIWGARAPDYAEQIYIYARRGLLRPPEAPLYREMVHELLLQDLESYGTASNPTDRHRLWTLQRAITALIDSGVFQPAARMLSLLRDNAVPDSEGGWVLTEGALSQPFDDPRVGAVLGTEIW